MVYFHSKNLTAYNLITFLIVIINGIIIYLVFVEKGLKVYFLITILGGSLGNLFDRLYYTAVPDFIDLNFNGYHWFIFNVADIFITLGIICLIFAELLNYKTKDEKNKFFNYFNIIWIIFIFLSDYVRSIVKEKKIRSRR